MIGALDTWFLGLLDRGLIFFGWSDGGRNMDKILETMEKVYFELVEFVDEFW